jgi:pimeloyl-ACP methyl ester carboxylesterase
MNARGLFWCVVVCLAAASGSPAEAAGKRARGPEGLWLATIHGGLFDVRLGLRLQRRADGTWAGTLDAIEEDKHGERFDAVEVKGDRVRLVRKKGKLTFEGRLVEDGTALRGLWRRGKTRLPLTFRRTDKLPVLARPQTPKRPFPYAEHEVVVVNKRAGIKLAGTLTVPRGRGPFPAVVLLTGSGPQDRDESLLGHKPFLVLSDYLTRRGIAVLRLDDRGVGGSGGDTMKTTLNEEADDALAAVAFLKTRQEIDPGKIGLAGHSEGGYIAPLAASRSRDVAFVVLLAGPGLSAEEVMYLQGQAILKAMGAGKSALKAQREVQGKIFAILKKEKDNDRARKLIVESVLDGQLGPAAKKGKQPPGLVAGGLQSALTWVRRQALDPLVAGQLQGQLNMMLTPWFRDMMLYDPRPALEKVRVPVLALIGEKDVQVPPRENFKALRAALEAAGNKDFTLKEMPGLNHLFQTCKTGSVGEYARIEETFAPAALEEVARWIRQRTGIEGRRPEKGKKGAGVTCTHLSFVGLRPSYTRSGWWCPVFTAERLDSAARGKRSATPGREGPRQSLPRRGCIGGGQSAAYATPPG